MDELENIPVTRHFGIPDNFYTMVTGNTLMDDLEHNPVTTDSGSVRTSGCYAVTGNSSMDDLEYIPVTTDSGTPGNCTVVTGNTSMDDLEHNPVTTDSCSVRTSECYAVTGNSSID